MSYLQYNPRSDSINSFLLSQLAKTDSHGGTRIEETSHAYREISKQPIFPSVCSLSSNIIHLWVLHTTSIVLPAHWTGVCHIWFVVAEGRGPAAEGAHTRMTILKRVAHCQGLRVAPSYAPPPLPTDKQSFMRCDFPFMCNPDCHFLSLIYTNTEKKMTREANCF